MDKNLKTTLAVIAFAIILQYSSVLCAVVCPSPAISVGNQNICPPGSYYDAGQQKCCMNVTDTPGGNGSYCNIPALLPGAPKCPATHPYDQAKMMCCGPTPITDEEKQAAARNASGLLNPTTQTGATCEDKAAPGRASDCPANANLCNNTLYMQLMTEQCPKTCGRCPAVGTPLSNAAAVPGTGGKGCVDGTNAQGISECAQNAFRCNQPIWGPFMLKECPFTCNPACKTGTNAVTATVAATTSSTTTTVAG